MHIINQHTDKAIFLWLLRNNAVFAPYLDTLSDRVQEAEIQAVSMGVLLLVACSGGEGGIIGTAKIIVKL
jgi:hypothetical protein